MSEEELDSFIKLNKITLQRGFESDKNLFQFELNDEEDILERINAFNNNEFVDYSNPNFRIILRRQDAPEENPLYKDQWALQEVHEFDINIKKAWNITNGKSSIVIAIIDDGVDYNHEDLKVNGKLAEGWDFVYPTPDSDPSPTGSDTHGTHCAGIASAAMNTKGIVGVAPGCRIMGLRVAHGDPWSNSQLIANAIEAFAFAMTKADVISCSWGLNNLPPLLIDKINEAATKGRNNKGIVICMAAGNYWKNDARRKDFNVMDTARLNSVVSVGAYGLDGLNKVITKEDLNSRTEKWGSRYEPPEAVDVLAPGVQILTTDVTGEQGNSDNDYFELFNGTSASTPFAAGAAALILSVNENLSSSRVREILIESTYQNAGRLDVLKALEIAQEE